MIELTLIYARAGEDVKAPAAWPDSKKRLLRRCSRRGTADAAQSR